jgi:hypothetical protein
LPTADIDAYPSMTQESPSEGQTTEATASSKRRRLAVVGLFATFATMSIGSGLLYAAATSLPNVPDPGGGVMALTNERSARIDLTLDYIARDAPDTPANLDVTVRVRDAAPNHVVGIAVILFGSAESRDMGQIDLGDGVKVATGALSDEDGGEQYGEVDAQTLFVNVLADGTGTTQSMDIATVPIEARIAARGSAQTIAQLPDALVLGAEGSESGIVFGPVHLKSFAGAWYSPPDTSFTISYADERYASVNPSLNPYLRVDQAFPSLSDLNDWKWRAVGGYLAPAILYTDLQEAKADQTAIFAAGTLIGIAGGCLVAAIQILVA